MSYSDGLKSAVSSEGQENAHGVGDARNEGRKGRCKGAEDTRTVPGCDDEGQAGAPYSLIGMNQRLHI